jgi:hypothetical protein
VHYGKSREPAKVIREKAHFTIGAIGDFQPVGMAGDDFFGLENDDFFSIFRML